MWCLGINRFIFHTYAHQPWLDKVPGMTMGQWGTHFGRTNTWWELSRPWMKYIARSQYLLQQGRTVADVLFFGGEAAPNGGVFRPELKAKGYEYDVDRHRSDYGLSVKDGLIRTPVGGSYRLLVLPDTEWMTPALAKKVAELVEAGATVLGPKPTKSPSLANYPACDAEVQKIADEVWPTTPGERKVGSGKIITGRTVEEVLAAEKVQPDFAVDQRQGQARLHPSGDRWRGHLLCRQSEAFARNGRLFVPRHRPPAGIVGRPRPGQSSLRRCGGSKNGRTIVTSELGASRLGFRGLPSSRPMRRLIRSLD